MRVKLSFEEPLPPYKCWYEVPATCSTIKDLQRSIRKGFKLDKVCKTTRLDLDGFFLLPASSIAGSLNDGDLLQVMIRRKSDILPPRSLPAAGGKKRELDEQETNLDKERSKRQRTRKRPQSLNQKPVNSASLNKATGKGSASGTQQPRKSDTQSPSKNSQQPSKKFPASSGNQQSKAGGQESGKSPQGKQLLKKPDLLPPAKNVIIKSIANVRKQDKTPTQPKKQIPTNAAQSSSSDSSSDSDSDSSDSDSDSDSSDSDDSDSSESSNDSEGSSEDMAKSVPNKTVSPPGTGSASTKGRNARRNARLKESRKKKLAELKAVVLGGSSVPERAAPPLAEDLPTKLAPAKVFRTTVKLQDQNPISRKQNTVQSMVTKTHEPVAPAFAPPHQTSTAASVGSHAVKVSSKEKAVLGEEEEHEESCGPRDYESLPKHTGEVRVGEVIAFKTLEIGADYSPIISEFKEAKVLRWSEVEKEAEVQLARKFREPLELDDEGRPVLGKFEVYDEEQFEMARRGIVVLDMLSIFDCRVIS